MKQCYLVKATHIKTGQILWVGQRKESRLYTPAEAQKVVNTWGKTGLMKNITIIPHFCEE